MVIGIVALLGVALLVGYLCELYATAQDELKFLPPGQLIDRGGRRVHMLCKGNAAGPTVVVETGAGEPSMLWWFVQEKIAKQCASA